MRSGLLFATAIRTGIAGAPSERYFVAAIRFAVAIGNCDAKWYSYPARSEDDARCDTGCNSRGYLCLGI